LNAWGKNREMPHPPAETFHQWFIKNRGGKR
jgi:L-lactate dehydrogenase complex protein LldF